ncbi:MAG: hypothetical protein KJ583_07010 [Nanoarchaeota archaeon]|nr:hypothetical protein [Nanoarchaeota archaeon]MBU1269204.1 hypothetical protein [Nanoarchaeota archaeon]MBU1605035.1 hypothetical protein [Nanoarchaeota archaeon]MBU2443587.1 hypothetical protein [Nanoarchaeota archaeon]
MLKRIEQKKARRKKFYIGAILVFLMIISMLGILLGNDGGAQFEYNKFKFEVENNLLVTKINGEKKTFRFLPQELLSIKTPADLKQTLKEPMMVLTFDPGVGVQNLIYLDLIRKDFSDSFDSFVQSGITNQSELYNMPLVNCDNATQSIPVIYFNLSNETSITKDDYCTVFNGQTIEFLKLRDLTLYIYYGVING